MGRTYTFECTRCGFQAAVSGGEDRGAQCFTDTCQCPACKTLFDAVTHIRLPGRLILPGSDPGQRRLSRKVAEVRLPGHVVCSGQVLRRALSMVGRLLPGAPANLWVEMKVACPVSALHKVRRWTQPGPCPRCGDYLDKATMPRLTWE